MRREFPFMTGFLFVRLEPFEATRVGEVFHREIGEASLEAATVTRIVSVPFSTAHFSGSLNHVIEPNGCIPPNDTIGAIIAITIIPFIFIFLS